MRGFFICTYKNMLKVFMRRKLKRSVKRHLENRYYFTRIKNQITAALIKLKKTAALPISLARFASL
jgi:hypothetical protein